MARVRRSLVALSGVALLGSGCSSSGSTRDTTQAPTGASASPSISQLTSAAADPVQVYLDAVNALCDQLLPKIITVTHGGSVDVPVKQFLASWPAHDRLLKSFDAQLAKIPVPPAARAKAAVLAAYIRFADRLDAARVTAARKGQDAYDKEMTREADVENDPAIAARNAAGFAQSCDAR